MSDLISREALLEDFKRTITEKSDTFDWLNLISRQPIAYDVDKVVEQLEELRDRGNKTGILQFGDIIETVKAGGANE